MLEKIPSMRAYKRKEVRAMLRIPLEIYTTKYHTTRPPMVLSIGEADSDVITS